MGKKRIILIVALILTMCIAGGLLYYFLDVYPKEQEEKELQAAFEEYYNSKISMFEEENNSISEVDFIFIGDSLTDGCDLSKYYSEYNAINRGISGDTTFGLEKRLKVSLYDLNPKTIVMLIGGNNLDTMFDNYENILISIQENLPATNVILVSLSAMGKELKSKNELAIKNNVEIKALAEKYSYYFVDIFTPLYNTETQEIYEEYTIDGAHFTDAGYIIVSDAVKELLETL